MPLSHLRVLEVATILAGPAVGSFLAELGADVIKVENPSSGGDPTRGWRLAQETSPPGLCAYFCSVNWGKRSVCLDLSGPADRERFLQLLPTADILLTNFKPGDAYKLGLSPESLVERHERLIVGCITGYGPDNPRGGFDVLIQAESGFMAMTGPKGGPCCRLPVALIDLLAAHQLKEALLLALLQREREGRGRVVGVSLWQAALASLANQGTNFLMAGYDPQPAGSEHPNLFPYGTLLDCADGDILLAVGTDRQFAALCQVLQDEAMAREFPTNALRVERREALRLRLQAQASSRLCAPFLAELTRAGVPSGQLNTVGQALESPAAQELLLRHDSLAGLRTVAFHGLGPTRPLRPPPALGQHTEEILTT